MKKNTKSLLIYLVPVLIFAAIFAFQSNFLKTEKFSFNQMVDSIENDKVKEILIRDNQVTGLLKDEKTSFVFDLPKGMEETFYRDYLKAPVESNKIKVSTEVVKEGSVLSNILPILISFLIFGIFWYFLLSRNQANNGGGSAAMNFGKSTAKLNTQDTKVKFKDVAGLKEEKEELMEVVDFLKNPSKYTRLGARIPKGILLVGPPGTGKTYLSRAVAGEAGVAFFSISGSDFVELYVGVGASRVRDLFDQAKKNAPCIIFIDEIDAVGRKRGAGLGGGHDEREQTLNQLLVEMDGFGKNEGIIVMAATNRPDILDPALLRPGRFDRNIRVGLPDVSEREEILKVHTKNKKLAPDVKLDDIAKTTTGFSPADLENLTNEAALLTARSGRELIDQNTFKEANIKVLAGPEKKSHKVIERERILTAYHEAGHAIVSRLLPFGDIINMITIIPRGQAGGFTAYIPKEDVSFMTKMQMNNELASLLGGRAAEKLALDDISTGASNDIERATKLARAMVTKYGMTDRLGPLAYETGDDSEVFLGQEIGKAKAYSDRLAYEIDREVRNLIDQAYELALKLLSDNFDLLHKLAEVLLEKETIHKDEFEDIFQKYVSKKDLKEAKDIKNNEDLKENIPYEIEDDSPKDTEGE
ncbi:MAG: ATP-dependent zinc metalloprotease FtsH [Finegoldia sp.]|nr:ATP-dependent zinc metalloprotease FtsH [Finegoldia sp.]